MADFGIRSARWVSAALAFALFCWPVRAALVGHWEFDDYSGSGTELTASDSSGQGNDGMLTNMPGDGTSWVTGQVGSYALSFDGANDYVSAARPTTVVDNFTLAAWINPAVLDQNEAAIVYVGDDPAGYGIIYGSNNSRLRGLYGLVTWIDSGYDFPQADRWYHVAMVRDGGTETFYVDGVATPGGDVAQTPNVPNDFFGIGNQPGRSRYFDGKIDDVRVYDQALSQAEIDDVYTGVPMMTSVVADDPDDGDEVYDVEDTITITFDIDTNESAAVTGTKYEPDMAGLFTLSSSSWGDPTDQYYITWADARTLVITVDVVSSATVAIDDTITILAAADIKDSTGTSAASTGTSDPMTGNWGDISPPAITSVVADGPDADPAYGADDTITITFSRETNESAAVSGVRTGDEMNALFSPSGGHIFGDVTDSFTLVWTDAYTLTVTVEVANAATIDIGDTITVLAAADIRNAPGSSPACTDESGAMTGDWGRSPEMCLVAHWKLDHEGLDTEAIDWSVNDNTGTLTNMDPPSDWGAGRIGAGLHFDGSDDFVMVPASAYYYYDQGVSYALWFKADVVIGYQMPVGQVGGGQYLNVMLSSTSLRLEVGSGQNVYANASIEADRWYHVVGTHDFATGMSRIYVDGQLDIESALTGVKDFTGLPVYLGSRSGGSEYFQGTIDDVRIYDRALSLAEIQTLYDMGGPAITSVTAADLDNDDEVYDVDDTITVVFDVDTNESAAVTGTKSGIDMAGLFTLSSSVWGDLTDQYYLRWADAKTLVIRVDVVGSATVAIGDTITILAAADIKDSAGATDASTSTSDPMSGDWGDMSPPAIASVVADDPDDSDPAYGADDTITITFDKDTNESMDGLTRTGTQMQSLFVLSGGHTFGGDTDSYLLEWTPDARTLRITVQAVGSGVVAIGDTITIQDAADIRNAPGTSPASTDESGAMTGNWGRSPEMCLVAHWKLDETVGTTAADSSGSGNDGDVNGNPDWYASGKIGGALDFHGYDGSDDYVEIPNSPSMENVQEGDYTLSAWVSPDTIPPDSTTNDRAYAILEKTGYHIGLYYDTNQHFGMDHRIAGDEWKGAGSGSAFAPGTFYHVVGVVSRTNGTVDVYVDGNLEGSNSFTPGTPSREYGTNPWRIGCANPGAADWRYPMDGKIDDVRIYDRALSRAEIEDLCNMGVPVIWSVLADDPDDGDGVYGAGDTITITFNKDTNESMDDLTRSGSDMAGLFALSSSFWGNATDQYYLSWSNAKTLVIRVDVFNSATVAIGDTVTVLAAANIRDSTGASAPSTDESGPMTGDWGNTSVPEIASVVADDPDDDDPAYGAGDVITITFNRDTNQSTAASGAKSGADMNALFSPSGGHTFGDVTDGFTLVWTDAFTLTITVEVANAATIDIGDAVTVLAAADIRNPGETLSASTDTSDPMIGDWGRSLEMCLVAHWKLDETDGTTAEDSVGENDGTINGFTLPGGSVAGEVDTAFVFDGVDDHINCGWPAVIAGLTEYTLMAWVRPDDTDMSTSWGHGDPILCKENGGYGFQLTWHYDAGNGRFGLMTKTATGVEMLWTPSDKTNGTWYHVAATFDKETGEATMYVDGVPEATGARMYEPNTVDVLCIGCMGGTTRFLAATIDDVRIYDRPLSEGEMLRIFTGGGVTIEATDPDAVEGPSGGETGAFTVTRTGKIDTALTVNFSLGGDAHDPNRAWPDYALSVESGGSIDAESGRLTFDPDVASVVVILTPIDDDEPEAPETATMTIEQGASYCVDPPDSDTVTITDDDVPGEFDPVSPPSPQDGDIEVNELADITLQWTDPDASGPPAETYTIILSTSPDMQDDTGYVSGYPVVQDHPNLSHTIGAGTLDPDMHIYWTVVASNIGGSRDIPEAPLEFYTTDTIPPWVARSDPKDLEEDIDSSLEIRVYFSERMAEAATTAAAEILGPDGELVPGAWSLDASGTVLVFEPDDRLEDESIYTVTVLATATDFVGNPLDGTTETRDGTGGQAGDEVTFSFTTWKALTGLARGEGCAPGGGLGAAWIVLALAGLAARRRPGWLCRTTDLSATLLA